MISLEWQQGVAFKVCRNIPQEFWAEWRNDKDAVKAQGFYVFKEEGAWEVRWFGKGDPPELCNQISVEEPLPPLPSIVDDTGLYPYQVEMTQKIKLALSRFGAALDASDTGTGKSYVMLAAARETNSKVLVVCPKSIVTHWWRVAQHMKCPEDIIDVVNWEKVRTGKTRHGIWTHGTGDKKKAFEWRIPSKAHIVFDEVHRAKDSTTLNAKLVYAAKKQGYKIMMASASVAYSPYHFGAIGYALGLHNRGESWKQFLYDHGCYSGKFGPTFNGKPEMLLKLHRSIFPHRGERVRKDDIKDFPECETSCVPIDLGETGTKQVAHAYDEAQYRLSQKEKVTALNVLAEYSKALQEAEMVRVPAMVERVEDRLDEGLSVVVFCNFSKTRESLCDALNTDCQVHGQQNGHQRQRAIDDFQDDKKHAIIVNIQAGGVGLSLHDIRGERPRHSIICPPRIPLDLRQALGRVHRAGAKSKAYQEVIFAANTIEEDVCRKLQSRMKALDTIQDGQCMGDIFANML